MEYPGELEMLEKLPVVAFDYDAEENTYWYDFRDHTGARLRLWFNPNYRSAQTDLWVDERLVSSVRQDRAAWLRIRQDKSGDSVVLGEFGPGASASEGSPRARLEVRFFPAILVRWSTLWGEFDYGQFSQFK